MKEHHQHLRNFFVIVPALSLSFVDHMLAAKDRAAQKGKEASFTDDGFPLGVAFRAGGGRTAPRPLAPVGALWGGRAGVCVS